MQLFLFVILLTFFIERSFHTNVKQQIGFLKQSTKEKMVARSKVLNQVVQEKFGNRYRVLAEIQRDHRYFTEGFVFVPTESGDFILESSGPNKEAMPEITEKPGWDSSCHY